MTGKEAPPDISKAVLTRWWWVNTAMDHLLEHWNDWEKFANASLQQTKSDTKWTKSFPEKV